MGRPPDSNDETLVGDDWTPGPESRIVIEEREPAPPPRRRLPTLWPWLLALLVLVLAGVGAAFYFARDDDKDAERTTQTQTQGVAEPAPVVPDLVGEQLNQSLEDLQEAGFRSEVAQVFAKQPSGVVVKQEPAAGTKLEEGEVVRLAVSKGIKPVPVPDVVGEQVSDATATLRKAGFELNIVSVPSNEPTGTVVAQNPAAGTVPETATTVRLNVAQEGNSSTTTGQTTTQGTTTGETTPQPPLRATVPDVVGLTQAQATKTLHDSGLKPSLQFVPSQQDPVGTVVAQAKAAGTTLGRGESVQINISVGPDQVALVAVPNIVGRSEQEARSQLQAAGFRVQVLREATDDPSESGTVVDRQPERAPADGLVTIYVGRTA
jgi:serine/threonine-protein kinase